MSLTHPSSTEHDLSPLGELAPRFVPVYSGRAASAARPGARVARGVRRAVTTAAWTAALALVAVLVGLALVPVIGDDRTVVVTGRSMTGSIPLGSVAVVEPVAPEALRTGDVITFDNPDGSGRKVTHRITSVATHPNTGQPLFTTKGDANDAADPWSISVVDDVAWRVHAHVPIVGHLFMAAASPASRILLIGLPVLLLAGTALWRIWGRPA